MKLVYKMFEEQIHFDIHQGQMRRNPAILDGYWFNHRGERLGWGDLTPDDMYQISRHLDQGEVFLVLSENEGFIEIPQGADVTRLSPDYVASKALFVITRGEVYYVTRDQRSSKIFGSIDPMPIEIVKGYIEWHQRKPGKLEQFLIKLLGLK